MYQNHHYTGDRNYKVNPTKSSTHNKTPLLPDQIKHNTAWVNLKVVFIVFLRRRTCRKSGFHIAESVKKSIQRFSLREPQGITQRRDHETRRDFVDYATMGA
jgi:hypothetical protein